MSNTYTPKKTAYSTWQAKRHILLFHAPVGVDRDTYIEKTTNRPTEKHSLAAHKLQFEKY